MNDSRRPGFWSKLGTALTRIRVVLANVFFFGALLLFLLIVFGGDERIDVPDGGALLIDPRGAIVEQVSVLDPLQEIFASGTGLAETALSDLLEALRRAGADDRIRMAVLNLDELQYVSMAHADALAGALRKFRESGKQVVAYGSYYDQQPYLIASSADAIYMHPFGQIMLPGYQVNQMYFKDLLDRLKVNVHIFRAGKYKEFIEPYSRTDMSAEAREANQAMVDALWHHFRNRVQTQRKLDPERFEHYTQSYDQALADMNGDFGRLAMEYHLVDELLTPDQVRARITDKVGTNGNGDINGIGLAAYLEATKGGESSGKNQPQVGVITAEGPIVMGPRARGVIAADEILTLIRRARDDESVRALVVRITTPGGSSFASELIRQELELTQLAGKPVVISMGPVAASGGYWVASTADAIVAEPTTITGSIGVFGILPTFEDSLAEIGISTDGVSTSALSSLDPLTGLNEPSARVLQSGTEHVYAQFVNLVARGRDMAVQQVEDVAQGRAWLGSAALERGLVDTLGDEQAAIARAAELAGVEDFGVRRIATPLSPRELLIRELTGMAGAPSPLSIHPLAREASEAMRLLNAFNDPRHSYAICTACTFLNR